MEKMFDNSQGQARRNQFQWQAAIGNLTYLNFSKTNKEMMACRNGAAVARHQ